MNEDNQNPAPIFSETPVSLDTISKLIVKIESVPKTERESTDIKRLNKYMENMSGPDMGMLERFVAWHRLPEEKRDIPDGSKNKFDF